MSYSTRSGSEKTVSASVHEDVSSSGDNIEVDDPRVVWLKTIIANQLGVFDPVYVNTLIAEHRQALDQFLNKRYERQAHLDRVIMYVWRTFFDRLVEEEITVLEEVPRASLPEKKEKKKKGAAKGKGRKKGGQDPEPPAEQAETEAAEATDFETEAEGEAEGEEDATVASSAKSSARSKRTRK